MPLKGRIVLDYIPITFTSMVLGTWYHEADTELLPVDISESGKWRAEKFSRGDIWREMEKENRANMGAHEETMNQQID